jgi:hypothetical protein
VGRAHLESQLRTELAAFEAKYAATVSSHVHNRLAVLSPGASSPSAAVSSETLARLSELLASAPSPEELKRLAGSVADARRDSALALEHAKSSIALVQRELKSSSLLTAPAVQSSDVGQQVCQIGWVVL